MARQTVHLVCNAHLDPVWLWHWEDGLAETLATFRIAAEFCEKQRGFVFNHNEALLYHWVEQHEPTLFKRILKLVKQGRWHIAGGAWLQPDVNGPQGESHIRQYLLGLGFFAEHFNSRPTTAYNFDPFGHPEGFAQILAGCGMDSYIFCRPDHGTYELPVGAFHWQDRSGCRVVARRSDDHYLTNGHIVRELDTWLPHFADEAETMILWGIGNHGGGPSRQEYADLKQYIADHPEYRFIESTPERFFATVDRAAIPTVSGEIQNSFPGCYTSMSRVKRGHRRCESLMAGTERLAALAWWLGRADYPAKDLDSAWKDILFTEFHDILPGSCMHEAERDSLDLLGRCADNLRRVRVATLWSLIRGEADAKDGAVPMFVVNPHGFRHRGQVAFECNLAHNPPKAGTALITVRDGRKVLASQRLRSAHNVRGDWRPRLVVDLDLQPFEIRRLEVSYTLGKAKAVRLPAATARSLRFTTAAGTVSINPRTGLIDHFAAPGRRQSLVGPGAFQPVAYQDTTHSWTCGDPKKAGKAIWSTLAGWTAPNGRFKLATRKQAAAVSPMPQELAVTAPPLDPIRIIERGDLQTVVEVVFVCDDSAVVRRYIIEHGKHGGIEIRDRLICNHKDHMLKLLVPFADGVGTTYAEAAYSVAERAPTKRHDDHPNGRWVAATGANGGCLEIANVGSTAYSCTAKALALNLVRTPSYSSFGFNPEDRFVMTGATRRQDQGEHDLVFRLRAADRFDERRVSEAAQVANTPAITQVAFPQAAPEKTSALADMAKAITVDKRNVHIVAVKRSEDGAALIVRLQEVGGRRLTQATVTVTGRAKPIAVELPRYGLKTLRIAKRGKKVTEVNLVEGL